MAAPKVSEATNLPAFSRRRDNALHATSDSRFQSLGHSLCSLSERDYEDAAVGVEIVEIFAYTQNAAITMHVSSECTLDRRIPKRGFEYFTCNGAHVPKLLIAPE
jgi:hypothetical protein